METEQLEKEQRPEAPPKLARDESKSFSLSWKAQVLISIVSFFVFVVLWQFLFVITADPIILASPVTVFQDLVAMFLGQLPVQITGLPTVYSAIGLTLEIMASAFALVLLAIPSGILMGRWKSLESVIDPWVNALYAIPMVALIPILYFAIGENFFAEVFVAFLISFFTVLINTYTGVKYTSNALAEVGRSFGCNERQFLWEIVLPASLPEIVAGLRLGLGRVVLGTFVAEILLSGNGLGIMMTAFQNLNYTSWLIAVISIMAIFGIIALQGPKLIERKYFKWKLTEGYARR